MRKQLRRRHKRPDPELVQGLQLAVDAAGGPSGLARLIHVSPQAVDQWRVKGRIPHERVIDVEAATGIDREDLRPDLFRRVTSKGVA